MGRFLRFLVAEERVAIEKRVVGKYRGHKERGGVAGEKWPYSLLVEIYIDPGPRFGID